MMLIKKNFIALLYIIHLFIFKVICETDPEPEPETETNCEDINDDNACNSSNNCLYLIKDSKCITNICNNLSSKPYYKITFEGEGDSLTATCETKKEKEENDNIKLIYESHELVEECPDEYILLEDICYSRSQLTGIGIGDDNKCSNYYYIVKKDGFSYIKCTSNCPSSYNYYDENSKCLQSCNYHIKIDNTDLHRCSSNCSHDGTEFEYEDISNSKYYCLLNCPNDYRFYYTTNYKCLLNCSENDVSEGNKCISKASCTSKTFSINLNKNIFSCLDNSNCPLDYAYSYKVVDEINSNTFTYCLKSCQDTQDKYFGTNGNSGETTYLNISDDGKKECLSENDGFFIDTINLKWVKDCKTATSGPYHKGNICLSICPNKITFDTLECIDNCNDVYFLSVSDSNICYKTCPANLGKGFQNYSINECQSCDKPKDPKNLVYGEGYYLYDENIRKCYFSCDNITTTGDEKYYHNKGDNICFTKDCFETNNYRYRGNDLKECINSCEEIKDLGYIYEKDYICYNNNETLLGDNDFFYISSGIYKYTNNEEECIEAGYKYLEDKQCVKECNPNVYRILPTNNKLGKCTSLIIPISTPIEDCPYYNKTSLICSNTCEFYNITDEDYIRDNNENCVIKCPQTLYEKVNQCVKECKVIGDEEWFIIEEMGEKKCVDQCNKFQLTIEENIIKCADNCSKINEDNENQILYLNYKIDQNGNKICVNECENDQVSLSLQNEHQLCLNECPQTHPFTSGKLCVDKCDYYLDDNCSEDCGTKKYIQIGNICSDEKCPTNSPFVYLINLKERENIKKCVPNCKDYELNYTYYKIINSSITNGGTETIFEEKICVLNCDGAEKIYNDRCLEKCPDGLYVNGSYCVSQCPKYFEREQDGTLNCITECPNSGDQPKIYLTSSKECVSECPEGEQFYDNEKNCLSICKNSEGEEIFYRKIGDKYECTDSCLETEVYINGTKECISSCPTTPVNYYKNGNVCYRTCISTDQPFSDYDNTCKNTCSAAYQYYGNDKICRSNCIDLPFNKIINDSNKLCVSECDLNSEYKYFNNITVTSGDPESTTYTLYCKTECDISNGLKRFLKSNYKCSQKCPEKNNYIVNNVSDVALECLSKCPDEKPYSRFDSLENENICSDVECGKNNEDATKEQEYYYLNEKKCIKECNNDDYIIKDTTICTSICDYYELKKLYYYENGEEKKCVFNCSETDLKYTSIDGKCVQKCEETEFYDENDKICRYKCPNGKKIDGQICRDSCIINETLQKYEDENGYCVENCNSSKTGYIYHNESKFQCLNNCPNLYIYDDECKINCNETKKYIYENNCVSICPLVKRFFTENNFTCLTDCPNDTRYYYETKVDGEEPKIYYECKRDCSSYIPSSNSLMNAQKCLGADCTGDFKYYIKINENQKECYTQCPSTHNFMNEYECLKECPEDKVKYPGDYNCINYEDCETGVIKYSTKECVEQCSKNDKIYLYNNYKESGKNIKFCVDNCTIVKTEIKTDSVDLKLSFNNECVDSCPQFSNVDGNYNCFCPRLFYYNKTTGFKTCLNPDLTLCEKELDNPILKIDTNECTTYCDGILSLSGYVCYNNSYKCEENETLTTLTNGDLKCVCLDKFYKTIENERNVTKCLKKDDACPSAFSLLIKETNECVKQCPTGYKLYGKTCVSTCPSNTKENSDSTKCECEGKWYISENYDVICTSNECPSEKKLYIEETKQCVSSCIGTGFEVYYNKTCIQSCSSITGVEQVESKYDPFLKDISKYYCRCNNIWYYDLKGNDICTDGSKSCDTIEGYNFKYIISSSQQCVDECPNDYYKFNDECLLDCRSEHIKDESSKMCKCKKLWKDENGKIVCLDLISCPEEDSLLIKRTNECYKGSTCPSEDPLLYDKICYNKNNCPEDLNTRYDETINKCTCVNKWYKENDKEKCLGQNSDCPPDYPYLNSLTKECYKKQENIETDLYEYNYVYYKNCPEKTIKDENSKKCVCDPLLGYWYTTQDSNGREILKCGEEQCPEIKKYNVFEQKECIPVCPDEYQYLYQGICYQKCPDLTEVIGNTKECQLKLVDNEINLQNLEKAMTENIVDLYKKSNSFTLKNNTSVGQKIVTKNATVEFYGVNRKNKGLSNQPIKSDLSYIDISECIEKIYKSNKMKENDDIVILKFDVNKIPNKFLINPVEYKLINSRTGQELDASICEHNSIRISYPVHDLINRYDKMTRKLRTLEYMKIDLTSNNKDSLREKIDKGKEIVEEYNDTDIFNINDRIFSDICIAVEVDGKDLVLEDRINYFYPQLSLCENNCTYNHTDFPNERIYCDCSYKTEFDFEREYSPSVDLNENQVKNDQNGNSNIAVMKCISNMKYSKSLKKNGGFIYSLIIIVIEFILLLIIAFYGISALGNKLKNKINKKEDNYEKEEIDVINSNEKENKKTEENIKTSERVLNNPTKKKKDNFGLEFIPQEYLFLFFNQGEKDVIKKVERDNVPFKTKYNTRILLEQRKGVNYDNINPRGPFPPGQNLLVIVDSMDEDINDYLGIDSSADEDENKNIVNVSKNKRKNKFNQTYTSGKGSRYSHGKGEKGDFKANQKAKLYRKNFDEFSYTDYDPSDENYSVYDMEEDGDEPHEKGFIDTLKSNQRFIKRNYDKAIKNKNKNFIEILFTEIIDKIYIIKILLFTRKFDILSLHLSVYLLCHTLLLVLNTLFFDIKTIKKIWASDNYPGLGYYLGYGFLACLVVWIIYTIFLCLLTNNDKIKDILKMIHFNNKYQLNKNKLIEKKYNNLMWKVKFKFIVYSIIEYLLLALCFLYLTTFGTVYIGTQSRAFKAYGIALIEILIIKIIYGIALAIMRYISLSKEKKSLYNVVLFMDTYLV